MDPLNINIQNCRYQALIGTGGVGSGLFFALDDDHTLGREESRSGRFLNQRDYCKLHIIAHYVKVLLGLVFEVILVSKVGEDDLGKHLMSEMASAGLDTRYVAVCPGEQTLQSVCFLYPDGTGGNLTASDSACSHVGEAYISSVESEFVRYSGRGVALAVPEVPLQARMHLLRLGREYHFLNAASFTSSEMFPAAQMGQFALIDLLSINLDEAASLLGFLAEEHPPKEIVESAVGRLRELNPFMKIAITAGKLGSYAWDGARLTYAPAHPVQVSSSAGAGDAFLAALIAGTVAGLPWSQCQELASLTAAFSVTSPHTIHPDLDRTSLNNFASQKGISISDAVKVLLSN